MWEYPKIIIHHLLPKIGLNRNTPRVLIYGPKSMGGLELMDLRIEQVATQWETTWGHLRRQDRARHGLYITAHDLQVELGSSTPFYKLDPTTYNYTTGDMRWNYLWATMYTLDLELEIYQFWTPKTGGVKDCNIMDVAVTDPLIRHSNGPYYTTSTDADCTLEPSSSVI